MSTVCGRPQGGSGPCGEGGGGQKRNFFLDVINGWPLIQSLGVQNSKASKMFDSQPLGHVICSNYIDYNLIILIFKGDVLINLDPLPCPHCGDPPPPSRWDALNGCSLSAFDQLLLLCGRPLCSTPYTC